MRDPKCKYQRFKDSDPLIGGFGGCAEVSEVWIPRQRLIRASQNEFPLRLTSVADLEPGSAITTAPFAPTPPAGRRGFILVHETLCDGLIPAEWDGDNQPVFYDTRAEAEVERLDAAEMRADAMTVANIVVADDSDDRWVEAVVLHPNGALSMVDQGLTFTVDALRELCR